MSSGGQPSSGVGAVGINTHSIEVGQVAGYASLGARVVRVDLPWSSVVHHDGEHWGAFDALVQELLAHRITPMLILQYDGPGHVSQPAARAELVRFAGAAAARYPFSIFEVLNEPDLPAEAWPYVAPEDYVVVVAEVGAAIRAAAPRASVIGPALGGGAPDSPYLAAAIASGLLAHVDAVSVHPYGVGDPTSAPAYYDSLRRMMGAQERPIVVSEWGFLEPEMEQAALVARALEVNERYGIGLTVVYRWRDAPDHPFGLTREDGSEKPAAAAVRAFTHR